MQQYTWFYTLAAPLAVEVEQALRTDFHAFLSQWNSHGTPVAGTIAIVHQQFVVVQAAPDDERPSGCSIDSMRRAVETLLQQYQLTRLDAAYIAYRDAQNIVKLAHFQEISSKIAAGEITADTLVFDNSLGNSDDLSQWEKPLAQTWMSRWLA